MPPTATRKKAPEAERFTSKEASGSRSERRRERQEMFLRRKAEEAAAAERAQAEQEMQAAPEQPLFAAVPARIASDLPRLKRLVRLVEPERHNMHLNPEVDRELSTWSLEHGVKLIPAMEGLVRALLAEDKDFKARVTDFVAEHGRDPSVSEVQRGPIHRALKSQLVELKERGA